MVYCHKCGAKNPDEEKVCRKCGSELYPSLEKEIERHADTCFGPRRRKEPFDECFGVPRGGAIFGILVGAIIIIVGLVYFLGQAFGWHLNVWNIVGPLVVIVVGALILAGAIYGLSRRS